MDPTTSASAGPSSSTTHETTRPETHPQPQQPRQQCAHCRTPSRTITAEDDDDAADDDDNAEKKEHGDSLAALKPCSKCHSEVYCSRECTKSGWKVHKKVCASLAQKYAASAKQTPAAAPRAPKREGHRAGLQKWQFDT